MISYNNILFCRFWFLFGVQKSRCPLSQLSRLPAVGYLRARR